MNNKRLTKIIAIGVMEGQNKPRRPASEWL